MVKVLGVSSSLRNARFGKGSDKLLNEIMQLNTKSELVSFLKKQTQVRLDDFFKAGRDQKLPFDLIYSQLKKMNGQNGLSNSEAALVAALWGAAQEEVEIDHLPLANYFSPTGKIFNEDELQQKILSADSILLATPVYFGDRSSLSQSFIEYLHANPELQAHVKNKAYAGVSVGAKRNGGQETTLIYQIIDMVNLNMLAVGNDSNTTAQYGGTAVAGDIGTFCKDDYGLDTCIGTGRRLGHVTKLLAQKSEVKAVKPINIDLWLLQDTEDKQGLAIYRQWVKRMQQQHPEVNFRLWDFTESSINRCIACDICPIESGDKEEYRCIITKKNDLFGKEHVELLKADAILLCAYSPKNRINVNSVYQKFIERTRYFRRDHYVFSDVLAAPFVISELSANQNLHIRMLTSLIRHHTILHHPLIGVESESNILNYEEILQQGDSFVKNAVKVYANKQQRAAKSTKYNPIGYVISLEKMAAEEVS